MQLPTIDISHLTTNNPLTTGNPILRKADQLSSGGTNPIIQRANALTIYNPLVENPVHAEMRKRSEYWFDYNNPNQVNSLADVIMRTGVSAYNNIIGLETWGQTFTSLFEDVTDLLYKGTIRPLMEGDVAALLNNAMVGSRELVNLVDNVWKGFAIGGGLLDIYKEDGKWNWRGEKTFSWADAWEGTRQAVVDRVNFNFDTGSRPMDFFLELATPTNAYLIGAGIGASKTGLKEAANKGITLGAGPDKLSRGMIKHFSKTYTGDVLETIQRLPYTATPAQVDLFKDLAIHSNAFTIIKNVNKIKRAVNVVDKAGPKLSRLTTTAIPWKIIKATAKRLDPGVMKYMAHAIDRVQKNVEQPSLISTFQHLPEYDKEIATLNAAQLMSGDPAVVISRGHLLSGAAHRDNKKILAIFDSMQRVYVTKDNINKIIESATFDGVALSWEGANELAHLQGRAKLIEALNEFAKEASGGIYETIEAYMNQVNLLSELVSDAPGIKALKETFKSLENYIEIQMKYDMRDTITKFVDEQVIGKSFSGMAQEVGELTKEMKALAAELGIELDEDGNEIAPEDIRFTKWADWKVDRQLAQEKYDEGSVNKGMIDAIKEKTLEDFDTEEYVLEEQKGPRTLHDKLEDNVGKLKEVTKMKQDATKIVKDLKLDPRKFQSEVMRLENLQAEMRYLDNKSSKLFNTRQELKPIVEAAEALQQVKEQRARTTPSKRGAFAERISELEQVVKDNKTQLSKYNETIKELDKLNEAKKELREKIEERQTNINAVNNLLNLTREHEALREQVKERRAEISEKTLRYNYLQQVSHKDLMENPDELYETTIGRVRMKVEELKQTLDGPMTETRRRFTTRTIDFLENDFTDLVHARLNPALYSGTVKQSVVSVYNTMMVLNNVANDFFQDSINASIDAATKSDFSRLSELLYSPDHFKRLDDMVQHVVEKLHGTRTNTVEETLKQVFKDSSGAFDKDKFDGFTEDVKSIINNITEHLDLEDNTRHFGVGEDINNVYTALEHILEKYDQTNDVSPEDLLALNDHLNFLRRRLGRIEKEYAQTQQDKGQEVVFSRSRKIAKTLATGTEEQIEATKKVDERTNAYLTELNDNFKTSVDDFIQKHEDGLAKYYSNKPTGMKNLQEFIQDTSEDKYNLPAGGSKVKTKLSKLLKQLEKDAKKLDKAGAISKDELDNIFKAQHKMQNKNIYVEASGIMFKQISDEDKSFELISNTLDQIENIQTLFEATADIDIMNAEELIKSYSTQVNRTFRNFALLNDDSVNALLNAVEHKDYEAMPVLETLSAVISRYDTSKINELRNIITSSGEGIAPEHLQEFQELMFEVLGLAVDDAVEILPYIQTYADYLLKHLDVVTEAKNSAATIMDVLEGMVSVRQFYGQVMREVDKGLDPEVASIFVDAVQNLYDKPAALVTLTDQMKDPNAFSKEVDKVIKNITEQMRSRSSKETVALEARLKNLFNLADQGKIPREHVDKYMEMFGDPRVEGGMSHMGAADAYATYILHQEFLDAPKNPMYKYVAIDVEATGLNVTGSTIYQQAVVIPDHNIFRLYINTGLTDAQLPVEDNLYYIHFGDKRKTGNLLEYKAAFKRIYQDGDIDEFHRWFGGHENFVVVPVRGEKEMLQAAHTYVKSQRPVKGKIQYLMHNGYEYDVPLLNNRAVHHGIPDVLYPKGTTIDTKRLLEKQIGVRELTKKEKSIIENLIVDHVYRRQAELTTKSLARAGANLGLEADNGDFLPTIGSDFMRAYETLREIFSPSGVKHEDLNTQLAQKGLVTGLADLTDGTEFFDDLTQAMNGTHAVLHELKKLDNTLKSHKIMVNPDDIDGGARLIPAGFFDGVADELITNHMGIDLYAVQTFDGLYVPLIGARTHTDVSMVQEFFDLGDTLVTETEARAMTHLAKNISKTMQYLRNTNEIEQMDLDVLHDLQTIFLYALQDIPGKNLFKPMLNHLKEGDTPLRAYATLYEILKTYENVTSGVSMMGFEPYRAMATANQAIMINNKTVWGTDFLKSILEVDRYKDILTSLLDRDSMFKLRIDEYSTATKMFTQEPPPGEFGKIVEHFTHAANLHLDNLYELEKIHDDLGAARVVRAIPMYRGLLDSFNDYEEAAKMMTFIHTLAQEHVGEGPAELALDAAFASLRPVTENFDTSVAYAKMGRVLQMGPEDMASYLRHQAKGLMFFSHTDLYSENYFVSRGNNKSEDFFKSNLTEFYEKILNNKTEYEKLGIKIKVTPVRTYFYFTEDSVDKIKDIAYRPLKEDFIEDEWMRQINNMIDYAYRNNISDLDSLVKNNPEVRERVTQALKNTLATRKQILELSPDGATSTLELLDDVAMGKILEEVIEDIPDVMSLESMKHLGVFDGNFFNHSVLGHIDSRRQAMEYSSFNPSKTMFNAANLVEKKLSTQMMYTKTIDTPEFKLSYILKGAKEKEKLDFLDWLKKSPNLKIAFLNRNPKDPNVDFRLASATVNTIKDLEWAMEHGASVLDRQTYENAYQIINNNKIKNPMMQMLSKVLVAPFKLGALAYNYAVAVRNIADTVGKNLQTTKDAAIIPVMIETTRDYFNYKNIMKEIYDHAVEQRIHIDVAVEEVFEKLGDKANITREVFNLFAEYQRVGGEIGLADEVLAYYGDATDKLYEQAGKEHSGMTEQEFRWMMEMTDEGAEEYLVNKFGEDPIRIRALLDFKEERLIYKRAYKMRDMYKGRDLGTTDFVNYLKSGRVDPIHLETMKDLTAKTKDIVAKDSMYTKLFRTPLFTHALDINMVTEEILRMSFFRYMKDTGFNSSQTMGHLLKTHFNYSMKSPTQVYTEMFFPFSTFRMRSIEYWAEQFHEHPETAQYMIKGWEALTNINDYDIEDIMLRRNLQYTVQTGNLIIDEDTGLTAKINPTAIDMLNFFAAPHAYVAGNIHPYAQAVKQLVFMEPYDGETRMEFQERKKSIAYGIVPFFGTRINRLRKANAEEESIVKSMLLGPLFNTTWTPAQGGAYKTWYNPSAYERIRRSNYNTYKGYTSYPRRRYSPTWGNYRKYDYDFRRKFKHIRGGYKDWYGFSTFNRTYYKALMKFRHGSVYPTKNYRSLNTAFSDVWKRSLTKKGNVKYKFLAFPTNKWTLHLKVNILRNITSTHRWA